MLAILAILFGRRRSLVPRRNILLNFSRHLFQANNNTLV
jgi:hypothetical protein